MTTVLVTGGCGFIGSCFVRMALQQTGYAVVNLDRLTYAGDPRRLADVEGNPRYRFVRGDILDAALVEDIVADQRPAAIVNFAAESHVDRSILDPAPFLTTNVLGVQVLLDAARRHRIDRFLQISTDEVYGDATGVGPFTEESRLLPSSPYAASKAAADLLCLAYQRTYALPVIIARSANNYGPFQYPEKLIPLMIRNALAGRELPVYGDGRQRRDWLFVEDNCRALLMLLERGDAGTVYNIACGSPVENLDLVRRVCAMLASELGADPDVLVSTIRLVRDRPGHDREYAISSDRIRTALGWNPAVPLDQGLRQTVRWYLANRPWLASAGTADYQKYYESIYVRGWETL